MIEIERRYLPKYIPKDLNNFDYAEIRDLYLPKVERHPILRIRKKDNKYVMTKKIKVNENDCTVFKEETINLSEEE